MFIVIEKESAGRYFAADDGREIRITRDGKRWAITHGESTVRFARTLRDAKTVTGQMFVMWQLTRDIKIARKIADKPYSAESNAAHASWVEMHLLRQDIYRSLCSLTTITSL